MSEEYGAERLLDEFEVLVGPGALFLDRVLRFGVLRDDAQGQAERDVEAAGAGAGGRFSGGGR